MDVRVFGVESPSLAPSENNTGFVQYRPHGFLHDDVSYIPPHTRAARPIEEEIPPANIHLDAANFWLRMAPFLLLISRIDVASLILYCVFLLIYIIMISLRCRGALSKLRD